MKSRDRLVSILLTAVVLLTFATAISSPPSLQAQTVQVLSADPPSTEQGAINLNVLIKGKGFKKGAKATFLVTGTNDNGGVQVNATNFVSTTSLTANINVSDAAVLSKYDIQVMNTDGRGGKGTELFSVTSKQTSCNVTEQFPTDGYCFSGVPGSPGCLDTTFGNGTGRVMAPPNSSVEGIALQSVGTELRVVTTGNTLNPCSMIMGRVWTVTRYRPDGSLDSSFGSGGVVKETFSKSYAVANAVLVQPDGKIVVAGKAPTGRQSTQYASVARYNPDGSRDLSFGGTGMVFVTQLIDATAVALQSDRKVVLTGIYGFGQFAAFRLNTNGTLDSTFNGTGIYINPTHYSGGDSLALQTVNGEEMIVVAGKFPDPTVTSNAAIWRLRTNGTLDVNFGVSGMAMIRGLEAFSSFSGVAVDNSNRILAVGATEIYLGPDRLLMARFDEAGNLDSNFGAGGIVNPPSRLEADGGQAIAVQPDGRIIAAGHSGSANAPGAIRHFAVWRFAPDGMFDPSFGDNGIVVDEFTGSDSRSFGLALQPDGKLVVAGYAKGVDGSSVFSALARFWY